MRVKIQSHVKNERERGRVSRDDRSVERKIDVDGRIQGPMD